MASRIRTLLLDNYDSYTYNLFQLLAEVNGAEPLVVPNDRITLEGIAQLVAEGAVHNIVISPGPGTPECSSDIGVCLEVLRSFPHIPILGVCLGHQALAQVHGGKVVKAPEPVHGRISSLQHTGHALMADIPSGEEQGFDVVRYHSLVVDAASLPPCLEAIAWTCGQHHAVVLQKDTLSASTQQQQEAPATPPAVAHSPGQTHSTGAAGAHPAGVSQAQGQSASGSGAGAAAGAEAAAGSSVAGSGVQGLIMGLAHRELPHFGVQFHPESVSTRFGIALLHNFGNITRALRGCSAVPRPPPSLVGPPGQAAAPRPWPSQEHQRGAELALSWQRLPGLLHAIQGGSETVFTTLYGWQKDTFWLDSSANDRGRFSYMGGRGGRLWRRITYRLPPTPSTPQGAAQGPPPQADHQHLEQGGGNGPSGVVEEEDWQGQLTRTHTWFLPYLASLLQRCRLAVTPQDSLGLPFNFWGGLVGYLGYELKAECGASNAHTSHTPDAAFLLADRMLAIDHATGDVYVLAMYRPEHGSNGGTGHSCAGASASTGSAAEGQGAGAGREGAGRQESGAGAGMCHSGGSSSGCGEEQQACAWLQATASALTALATGHATHSAAGAGPGWTPPTPSIPPTPTGPHAANDAGVPRGAGMLKGTGAPPAFRLRHSRQQYMANIEAYRQALYDGESYEVCATTALERPHAPDPAQLYSTLRRLNPAPYAAWLRLGGPEGLSVCCSSPERFLCCLRGSVLEARPIKGTAPRRPADPQEDARLAAELAGSEKERAENLMIVDLLRNDLGRVCEVGSVHVPGLMEIESFATVHQMVSTVRGLRRADASIVDCLRAAFPGGSMTGAPKVRTMEILDAREGHARGVYSGSLGFISFNDTFDLNIVIRTAVIREPNDTHAQGQAQDQGQGHGQGQGQGQGEVRKAAAATAAAQQLPDLPTPCSTDGRASPADPAGCRSVQQGGAGRGTEDHGWISIGAGGAIVVQSDTGAEYEEMRLKARALLQAVGMCDGLGAPATVDDAAPAYVRERKGWLEA